MQNSSFKLDRSAFHMGSHKDTENYHAQCQLTTYIDRLNAAAYLTYSAFGFDPAKPPRLNKTCFAARKHNGEFI